MRKRVAFPVGLHGMLLFALCWLTLPGAFAPLERVLLGAVAGVGRAWAALAGEPAAAASSEARDQLARLSSELARRIGDHAERGVPPAFARGAVPVHCAVIEATRRGGGGEPSELRLDRTYAELADARACVTKGSAFVGFLQHPGLGAAANDTVNDHARVILPNHASCPPLHAQVEAEDVGPLRLVVRAAAPADPAPLRVELWDDPFRASRMQRAGAPVYSREVATGALLPAGLQIGITRIWGYPRTEDGPALTLGVFVAPVVAGNALSHVVVWRDPAAPALASEPPAAPEWRSAVVHELPGATHGRSLLVGAGPVADGAAVLQDGYLLGTAKALAFGSALVTSFAASRHRWSLVLLPDDPDAAPLEFAGEVVRSEGSRVCLRVLGHGVVAAGTRPAAGHLFTGSNGLACPSGLWIGRATPDPQALDRWLVAVPGERGSRAVQVLDLRSRR